jgi:hypothetical protein
MFDPEDSSILYAGFDWEIKKALLEAATGPIFAYLMMMTLTRFPQLLSCPAGLIRIQSLLV